MADEQDLPPAGQNPTDGNYASEGYTTDSDRQYYTDAPSLQEEAPAVSGAQNKRFIIIIIGIITVAFVGFMFFSGGEEVPENAPPPEEEVVAPPSSEAINMAASSATDEILPAPQVPEPPIPDVTQMSGDIPPPPPPVPDIIETPPVPPISEAPVVDPDAAAAEALKRDQRRRAGMVVMDGKSTATAAAESAGLAPATASTDPNLNFSKAQPTDAQQVMARRVGKMENMIVQGKIVEAVLETAINSDLPGPIRAILSRDSYSESGKNILLPKGSRLIGTYNTAILGGQRRIYVVWSRVIRPDGIDVMIDSPGIDQIGRAGVEGVVDTKIFEIYSNAILSSILTIGVAAAGEAAVGGEVTQSQNAIGGTQTTGSAGAMATQQAVQDLGNVTKQVVTGIVDMRPTIMLDQGSRVNVFVNKDLIFPPELFKNTQFIQ